MSRRIAFVVLCIFFITQCLPITAFADLALESYKSEEELKKAIMGESKWVEDYPNGLFNFIGTQFEINENQKFLEFAVVRQGGTVGKTSVKFKAIDISAEYGKDYVIRAYENFKKNEIPKNEAAIMLMDTVGDNASINISESSKKKTVAEEVYGAAFDEEEQETLEEETAAVEGAKPTVTEAVYENNYEDLPKLDIAFGEGTPNSVSSLRQARESYLGQKSDRPTWRNIDSSKVEELKKEYDKFLYNMPGTETTLEFNDGEYIKYLYFIPLNDKISESEEQVMFALGKPEGGASRGEFYMSYVNIIDDEEPEEVVFEMENTTVSARDGVASVVVKRTGGLHQYSSVLIGTEEGSAIAGADYEPGMEELFFTPGMTKQTVSVNVLENTRRGKDRQFTIALDRTNEGVRVASAGTVITLPTFSGAKTLALEESQNINAEKIAPYGYSPEKGKWTLTGEDFIKAGKLGISGGIAPIVTERGIAYNYTAKGPSAQGMAQGTEYYFDSLGGVDKIHYYYYNNGNGKSGKYNLQGSVVLYYTNSKNQLFRENDYTYTEFGKCSTPIKKETLPLNLKKWTTPSKISFDTYANDGNHTAPSFSDITLNLKEYSTSIVESQKLQRQKYTITKGIIKSDRIYKEYTPGSLYVKRVDSNVGNYQKEPVNPKVYRSDRIEFGYQYSTDNPNGKYSVYKGFEIKNGSSWIYFPGTELVLNGDFFKKNGIFEAINTGTITIRPVFEKIKTYFQINFDDTANGYLKNAPGLDVTKDTYLSFKDNLYIGDMISDLEAQTNYASKLPAWSSYKGRSDQPSPECIDVKDTVANTKIDYFLENSRNWLWLEFKDPSIIIKADPNVYKSSISMVEYKLDDKAYTSWEDFSKAVQEAYEAKRNPKLDMEFKYVFSTDFPDSDGKVKEEFGTPQRAILTVYKNDGTVRNTYFTDYNKESDLFKLSKIPVEEGWELDDIATIYIEGSKVIQGRRSQTQELVIDFLTTSRSGIVVLPPNGEDFLPQYGDTKTPVTIDGANPLKYYKMRAFTPPGFTAVWADFSPDMNNDGENSHAEEVELEKKLRLLLNDPQVKLADKNIWVNESYYGKSFSYMPKFFNPSKIYYTFEKLQTSTAQKNIEFKLLERYSTVLYPDIYSWDLPIKDAQVFIGENQIEDSGKGLYKDRGYYQSGRYYMGQLLFGGQEYIFPVKPGDMSIVINTSDLVRPYDFKGYITEGSKEEEQNLKNNNGLISIKNAVTRFKYKLNGSGAGVVPNDSIVRIYDFEGKLHSEVRTGPPSNGEFSYKLNSFLEGVKAGYTMTIAGLMTKSDGEVIQEYPEVRTGVTFKDPLTAIKALASFTTDVKPMLDMIGKINNNFDLGMDVEIEEKRAKEMGASLDKADYTDTKGFSRKAKTLTFGFSDDYVKKHEDTVKKPEKNAVDTLKEDVKKEGAKDTVDKAVKDGKDKGSGGGDFNMKYKISLAITIEDGQVQSAKYDGKQYFRSMVIMATATADYKKERTYMTPIGIPVTVTLWAHGNATAVLAFDAYKEDYKEQYVAEYCLSGTGTASLSPKYYDIYTKFIINPTITLGAAAGFDYLNLWVEGNAVFDFAFDLPITGHTTGSSGSGGLKVDASLGIEMLFYKKSWTLYKSKHIDLFNIGERLGSTGDDYLYEEIDGISDDEVMNRDYLEYKGGWGEAENLKGVSAGDEKVLQEGVFPNPQTKLIKLDESRTMLLFIEDDASRDSRNRASLMYSIIEGGNASLPIPLDDDGTWDEAPDAFMVNGDILIVWSDAGKIFTTEDDEIDILSSMNISGRWFDTDTESLGSEFAITKTVEGGDCYSDLRPRISYDASKKRLMVYYTKIDHSDSWEVPLHSTDPETEPILEMPSPLYGDIINGYNLIAYRYADYDEASGEFKWNETYSPEEKLSSEQYYGQRFLSLAPLAEIMEEEYEIEDETISIEGEDITLKHIGTRQIVESYKGLADPRIVEMDLTTQDGLALFAYIMDYDGDLKTPHDQQLYVQTYNYEENAFSYPIQITNNDLQDTKSQFVYINGITYLYWLQDGKIVYTDISDLLAGGRLKEVSVPGGSGKKLNIINKANTSKDAHISIAVEHEDRIDEYKIASDGERVYALWNEEIISYKNGLKPGEEGTEDPSNINKERQLFAARALADFSWSSPVQLTFEEGQSFSNLAVTVMGEDEFLTSYARFVQYYDEELGHFADDNSARTLAINTFLVTNEPKLGEIELNTDRPMAGEGLSGEINVFNTGLKTLKDYEYQYYLYCDGEKYYESPWHSRGGEYSEDYIPGGGLISLKANIDMPESLEDVDKLHIGFRVKAASGTISVSKEKELTVKPDISIRIMEKELQSKDSACFGIYVENLGNKAFDDEFTLKNSSKILYKDNIKLEAGEGKIILFEADLEGAKFGELLEGEDGGRYDLLPLMFKFGEYEKTTDLKRRITAGHFNEMQNIKSFNIVRDGQYIQEGSTFVVNKNSVIPLKTAVANKEAQAGEISDMLRVSWSSSNPQAISVMSNGTLVVGSSGAAVITATLHPDIRTTMAYEDGSFEISDASYTIPEGALNKKSFIVKISSEAAENPKDKDSERDSTINEKAQPTPQRTDSVIAKLDSSTGIAYAEIKEDLLAKAFERANSIEIAVSEAEGANAYELKLPAKALSNGDESKKITLKTAMGTVTLSGTMFSAEETAGAQTVSLKIASVDKSKLSEEIRAEIGERPIIELSLKLDGKQIYWNNPSAPVSVSIPYVPTAKELENPEHIVIRYIDGNGNIVSIPSGRYDEKTGTVTFITTHFSKYAVSYIYRSFDDIDGVMWAKKSIEVMASKGIINGTGGNSYLPKANITRADYLMLLIKTLGLAADFESSFEDVKKGDYYYEAVGIAKKLGIAEGSGSNRFNPKENISRQDMVVLTARALEEFRGLEASKDRAVLSSFGDNGDIAAYAAGSMATLVKEGIIAGSQNKINPREQTTRAEAAVLLYRIYNKY